MKIKVDGIDLFELTPIQKKVICNEIPDAIMEADMKRRLHYIIMHKYEQCLMRLRKEWEPKLAASGHTSLPVDKDEFAKLVFAHKDYKSRQKKELDQLAEMNANRLEKDPKAEPLKLNFRNPAVNPFLKNADEGIVF